MNMIGWMSDEELSEFNMGTADLLSARRALPPTKTKGDRKRRSPEDEANSDRNMRLARKRFDAASTPPVKEED